MTILSAWKKQNNKERDTRRSFTASQKKQLQYQQGGKCAMCKKPLDPRDIEYDHKKAWADGGRTTIVNGRALCGSCHNKASHGQHLNKVEKKPKKPAKKSTSPFDVSLPPMELPKMKTPKGKGGFGLF
ncbi:HNH endonuclease [Methanocella arvoryzae]|uniref:HNH nuclease domain-containing protein n=1 Tax=Methanocella arvoryzae (strain DSM 22066 / NBRC 105507 / MRE50) TaxID=351160 RepID=Q0W2T3_METAR|nr:HNH endonuclease signature motif containing protein [Methanocella arvoryzae]CAJ37310.1 hypothetical protein RCIX2189 [Methanocella arvoryzae MRE50]